MTDVESVATLEDSRENDGSEEIVSKEGRRILFDVHGDEPEKRSFYEEICAAIIQGDENVVNDLLQHHSDMERTPIKIFLIDVETDARSEVGSVVGLACRLGRAHAFQLLLESGFPFDHTNSQGWTPSHEAAIANDKYGLRTLMKHGDWNQPFEAKDNDGNTAYDLASAEVKAFLQKHRENKSTHESQSSLIASSQRGETSQNNANIVSASLEANSGATTVPDAPGVVGTSMTESIQPPIQVCDGQDAQGVLGIAEPKPQGCDAGAKDHLRAIQERAHAAYSEHRLPDAADAYAEAVMEGGNILGEDDPYVGVTCNNLARVLVKMDKYDEAEPLYERARSIFESNSNSKDPAIVKSLNGLALISKHKGKFEQAEQLYKRAIEIGEAAHGPDNPDVAGTRHNLGLLKADQGKYDEAKEQYERAIGIGDRVLGPDHKHVVEWRKSFEVLLQLPQFKDDEALPAADAMGVVDSLDTNSAAETEPSNDQGATDSASSTSPEIEESIMSTQGQTVPNTINGFYYTETIVTPARYEGQLVIPAFSEIEESIMSTQGQTVPNTINGFYYTETIDTPAPYEREGNNLILLQHEGDQDATDDDDTASTTSLAFSEIEESIMSTQGQTFFRDGPTIDGFHGTFTIVTAAYEGQLEQLGRPSSPTSVQECEGL